MKLTTIILTKSNEVHLAQAIKSVRFSDEVLTIENDTITDFSEVRNSAMKKVKGEWILFVDSDEIISDELKEEIQTVIANPSTLPEINSVKQSRNKIAASPPNSAGPRNDTIAYCLRRRDFFWGRELKFGEIEKSRNSGIVRLVKKDSGTWKGAVHEEFKTEGPVGRLNGYIDHYPHPTVNEFISKINIYSTLRAKELQKKGHKENIFAIIFYPLAKFIFTYFFKLGFLDGAAGFVYAFMMSFHSFLVRAKLYQYNKIRPT